MWISDYVTRNSFTPDEASRGEVVGTGEKGVAVAAQNSYFNLPQAAPAGIVSIPAKGDRTVVLPTRSGGIMLGVIPRAEDLPAGIELSAGELMLYSAGGATIVLRNDGTIELNGRTVS